MLDKIAQSLPPSPTLNATESNKIKLFHPAFRELVDSFRHIVSTKRKDSPMDLPAEFIHNLMVTKRIMDSQRAEDLDRLLECVERMKAILEVRRCCCRAANFVIVTPFWLRNQTQRLIIISSHASTHDAFACRTSEYLLGGPYV
jgi:hypothetical protein